MKRQKWRSALPYLAVRGSSGEFAGSRALAVGHDTPYEEMSRLDSNPQQSNRDPCDGSNPFPKDSLHGPLNNQAGTSENWKTTMNGTPQMSLF